MLDFQKDLFDRLILLISELYKYESYYGDNLVDLIINMDYCAADVQFCYDSDSVYIILRMLDHMATYANYVGPLRNVASPEGATLDHMATYANYVGGGSPVGELSGPMGPSSDTHYVTGPTGSLVDNFPYMTLSSDSLRDISDLNSFVAHMLSTIKSEENGYVIANTMEV